MEIPDVFSYDHTIDELKELIKKGYKLRHWWDKKTSKGGFYVYHRIPVEITFFSKDFTDKKKWLEIKEKLEEVV